MRPYDLGRRPAGGARQTTKHDDRKLRRTANWQIPWRPSKSRWARRPRSRYGRCAAASVPAQGSRRLSSERVRLRSQTGLSELPSPAPLQPTPAEQTRALLHSLENDAELCGVARLARNAAAAVHLPKPIAEFDDLPLGGVSDISNRGRLDQLLLSELAHDDLTLAVRVAMNEALYLRRESPPRSPPRQRFVLLDAGLRTWGVPRVFATAIGLALAASSDRQIETQVFRSTDDDVAPVDFTSREGLVAHLGALATAVHPAAALTALIDQIEAPGATDAILVTTEDTLLDAEFSRGAGRSRTCRSCTWPRSTAAVSCGCCLFRVAAERSCAKRGSRSTSC